MTTPRIRRCHNLDAVSRLVARDCRFSFSMKQLRSTKTREQHYLLSAPATLAVALDAEGVDWPTGRELRVLVINPSRDDFHDRGQWFRFVPAMLEAAGAIAIDACGVNRSKLLASTVPEALLAHDRIPVNLFSESVSDLLTSKALNYDLAISFSQLVPGQSLLDDLIELAEHGIPLYFASSSSTLALFNHLLMRAHSAQAEAVVAINPFALPTDRPGEQANRVLSKVAPENLPFPGDAINTEYADALDVVGRMVLHSLRVGRATQDWAVGAPVDGGAIHTLDGICVDLESLRIIDANTDTELGTLHERWCEPIQEYDQGWAEEDRLLWAAYVRYFALSDGLFSSFDQTAA
jgi:hypothetical protein